MYEHRFQQDPNIRVGDSEREQAGDRLRRAHAEGRLDPDELQDRIDRCYEAKTLGELAELVADLPREENPRERSFGQMGSFLPRLGTVVPILLAIFLISAVIHGHVLWALLPLFLLMRFLMWRRRPWRRWHDGSADLRV